MLSFIIAVAVIGGLIGLTAAMFLGWTPDTTQPGRKWYPAGPDPEPWRTD
jgi:hypothetical protein